MRRNSTNFSGKTQLLAINLCGADADEVTSSLTNVSIGKTPDNAKQMDIPTNARFGKIFCAERSDIRIMNDLIL